MFKLASIFFLLALVSAYFGFVDTSSPVSPPALLLFVVFVILGIVIAAIDPERLHV